MSGQTWTPAPKKGIIPLHPLTFGMLLGKSFAALRHNPKVLFGFGVVIQLVVTVVSSVVMAFVFVTTFTRLMTVSPASADFEAVFAGTIAMNLVAGVAVGLASVAFTAMMQGVVAAEIGFAAIGVKATLGTLWRRMTPAFWRLVAFSALFLLFVFGMVVLIVAVVAAFVAGGIGSTPELLGVLVVIVLLLVLASIPLTVWLSTKLLLVPSILVLERATLRTAFVRSWRLTRGRFWVAFGVTALIGVIMGLAMQVVGIPVSLLSTLLGSVIAPTGSSDPSAIMGFVFALLAPQVLLLVIQAISVVVQSSGGVLVYLDSRMRYEGLDQALIAHVERRDLGWSEEQLGDPFAVDPARAVTSAPPQQSPAAYPPPYAPQQYPPAYAAPQYPYAAAPQSPPPAYAPPAHPQAAPQTQPPTHVAGTQSSSSGAAPVTPDHPSPWTAPGSEGQA